MPPGRLPDILVLFDIDGTLLRAEYPDGGQFPDTVREVLELPELNCHWNEYEHVTETHIPRAAYREHYDRPLPDALLARLRERFVERIRAQLAKGGRLDPLPGARAMLQALIDSPHHAAAFATGSYSEAARLKLGQAGLPHENLPLVSSDHCANREGISRIALAELRRAARHGQPGGRAVYVGDGLWDLKACRRLGLPFVGIGKRHEMLGEQGASHHLPDFLDLTAFLDALEQCEAPAPAAAETTP